MSLINKFSPRSFDWILVSAVLLLSLLGLTAIYSVDLSRGAELIYFKKQLISLGVGVAAMLTASLIQHTFYRSAAKLFYLATIALLIGVLIFGRSIRGTTGWFNVGAFSFQPVELAKLGIILMMAHIVSNFGRRFERPLFFYGTGAVAGLVMALILAQPDLGSAALIALIWFGLMLLLGARKSHVYIFLALVLAAGVMGWFFLLKDYQKERLLTFVNPNRDVLGSGYNITQSIIAVGSGKLFGRGLGFGSQSQLHFLPETQTDFIFSVIGEELGLSGVTVLVTIFGVMLWRLALIVKRTSDDFVAVAVSGMIILFFGQFFINVGADIGLLPITGVPLPFVSYGGSSLLMGWIMIGVAESMISKKY